MSYLITADDRTVGSAPGLDEAWDAAWQYFCERGRRRRGQGAVVRVVDPFGHGLLELACTITCPAYHTIYAVGRPDGAGGYAMKHGPTHDAALLLFVTGDDGDFLMQVVEQPAPRGPRFTPLYRWRDGKWRQLVPKRGTP